MTNKRLGKGLEALITTHSTEERFLDGAVPIDKIIPNISNLDRDSFKSSTLDSIRALRLIRAFRINGHLIANLDPLGIAKKESHAELDFQNYGFAKSDLDITDEILKILNEKIKEIKFE